MSAPEMVSILESDVDWALADAFRHSRAVRESFLRSVLAADFEHELHEVLVSDVVNGRETDVLLLVSGNSAGIFACLIEDKVTAGFTPGQPQAYRQRGEYGIITGRWRAFRTVLFAPEGYLSAYRGTDLFDAYVAFESFTAGARAGSAEPAVARLAAVLRAGIEKHRENRLPPDEAAIEFWRAFRQHVAAQALPYRIGRLEARQSSADPWPTIYLKDVAGKRDHLCVQLKPRKGEVVLWFNKMTPSMLQALTAGTLPAGATVIRDGTSASVLLRVPRLDHRKPFASQLAAVASALSAMTTLHDYYHAVLAAKIDWPPPSPGR